MSVNSGLKVTKIKGQRKAFYRQRILEFSCARKETVYIDILVTSRKGDRKIMQSIRITSRSRSRTRKWNQLSQFWRISTKVIYRKDLSWPHFHWPLATHLSEQMKPRDLRNIHTTVNSCRDALPRANMALKLPWYFYLLMENLLGRYLQVQSLCYQALRCNQKAPIPVSSRWQVMSGWAKKW